MHLAIFIAVLESQHLLFKIMLFSPYAAISFIQNHPHLVHYLKGTKTLPPGQSLCTETLPLGQNKESKDPPLGHKVGKFHKCIYKLTLFKMKSFVVSNKMVFQ